MLITAGHFSESIFGNSAQEGTHCNIKKKKKKNSIELFSFAKLEQDFGLWFSRLLLL